MLHKCVKCTWLVTVASAIARILDGTNIELDAYRMGTNIYGYIAIWVLVVIKKQLENICGSIIGWIQSLLKYR